MTGNFRLFRTLHVKFFKVIEIFINVTYESQIKRNGHQQDITVQLIQNMFIYIYSFQPTFECPLHV